MYEIGDNARELYIAYANITFAPEILAMPTSFTSGRGGVLSSTPTVKRLQYSCLRFLMSILVFTRLPTGFSPPVGVGYKGAPAPWMAVIWKWIV